MYRILALALAFLLLCGCGYASENTESGRAVRTVYTSTAESLLAPQEVAIGVLEQDAEIKRLFALMCDLQLSDFCEDVKLESYTILGDTLTLQVSQEYASVTGLSRTLCDGALTLTFCELPYVNTVVIRTDGADSEPMTRETFLLDLPLKSSEQESELYFVKDGALSAEIRTIPSGSEEDFLKSVTEALLSGPRSHAYTSPIPGGTRVHSVALSDGVCTVDLSAEFLSLLSHTEEEERLCLFSLVNTVAHASDARQVRILIDGESRPGFTHYDLTQAIQPELFD